jgi:hypothetical protein
LEAAHRQGGTDTGVARQHRLEVGMAAKVLVLVLDPGGTDRVTCRHLGGALLVESGPPDPGDMESSLLAFGQSLVRFENVMASSRSCPFCVPFA